MYYLVYPMTLTSYCLPIIQTDHKSIKFCLFVQHNYCVQLRETIRAHIVSNAFGIVEITVYRFTSS